MNSPKNDYCMKHTIYWIKFFTCRVLCGCLLLLAAGSVDLQAQCRRFVQSSASTSHYLAVADDGTLWAWGLNRYGQLGDGTTTDRIDPVQVGRDRNWKQVKAAVLYSLAVKTDGTLWAWGNNSHGQLGDGTTTNRIQPVQVGTDIDWELPSASSNLSNPSSLAIKTNGSLWFFGSDKDYQSGLSDEAPHHIPHVEMRTTPTQVGGGTYDWKVISVGECHTIGIKTDGTLWVWGRNIYRQVGYGIALETLKAPLRLGTDADWKTVAAGREFNLAIKQDGTLWAWGRNSHGELGNGVIGDYQAMATQVGTDRDWKMVAADYYTALALKSDGSIWVWGNGENGQFGDGTVTLKRGIPTRVGWGADWVNLNVCSSLVSALRSDGSLWSWGRAAFIRQQSNIEFTGNNYVFPTRFYCHDFIKGVIGYGEERTLTSTDKWHYFEKDCRLICKVAQTNNWGVGTRPTGNSLTARVWVDGNTVRYVKRHYQITPAINPATTTGRVTLYFTQEEFDEFNAVPANINKLPTRPFNRVSIRNLRIEKRGGVSADGSGSPASYSGAVETIDPADDDVQWNAANRLWEVTFNVTGFSGFWVKTIDVPLPATFRNLAAHCKGGTLWVDWRVEKETNTSRYEIEVSADGKTFLKIGELCSKAADGNSDTAIEYRFQTPGASLLGAAGIAGVGLVLLAFAAGYGGKGSRKRLFPVAIIAMILWGAAACSKKSKEVIASSTQKAWVRIALVDKDGTKEYSKIVQVITED